jgi:hypothetical protein
VGTASDTGTTVLLVQYFPLPAPWVFSLLTEVEKDGPSDQGKMMESTRNVPIPCILVLV